MGEEGPGMAAEKELMKDKRASRTKLSEEVGTLVLTDRRLTYAGQKKSQGAAMAGYFVGGIIGSVIADKVSSKDLGQMAIMVSDIAGVTFSKGSMFGGGKEIVITLKNGETVRFVVQKPEKWANAIRSRIS